MLATKGCGQSTCVFRKLTVLLHQEFDSCSHLGLLLRVFGVDVLYLLAKLLELRLHWCQQSIDAFRAGLFQVFGFIFQNLVGKVLKLSCHYCLVLL